MSISSFGTNDFIDLNTASLDQEEDDDLGSQYNRNSAPFRYSLRSIDEAETERIRRSLVSPSSKYSSLDVPSGTKSPSSQSSYAESIALFRNMDKMGNEPIDLVTSQFRDYFDYDLDDLCSSVGSKSPSQAKKQIGLLASLNNIKELKVGKAEEEQDSLPENNDLHSSPLSPHSSYLRHTRNSSVAQTTADTHSSNRKSVDSNALRKLRSEQQQQSILKRYNSMNNNSNRPAITSPLATPITTTPSKSRIPSRIIRSNTTVPPITNINNNINVTKAGSLLPQSITGRRWSSYDTTENKSKATSPQKEAADRKLSRQSVLIADPTQNHRRLNTLMIVNNSRRPLPSQHENATILDHDGKPLEASTFKVIRRKSIHVQKSSDNIRHLSDKKDRQYDSLSSNDNKQSRNNLSSNDKRTSSIHRGNSSEQLNKTPQRYNNSSRRLTTTSSPHHDNTRSPPALIVPPTRHSSRVASLSIGNSQRANHDIRKSSLVNTTSSLSKKHPITTNTTSTIHLQHKEPVPVATRYRRSSNQAIASAASKDEAITFDIIPTKEVRFSNPIANSPHLLNEQVIDVVASRSSGGFSNSTTSSSHSGDLYYDPPATVHHHKRDSPILMSPQRRKSTTVLNTTTSEPTHLKKPSEYRYSSYLSHIKNQREHNHIENDATRSAASRLIALSRKQRTFAEDHNGSINNNSSLQQLPRQRASSLYQSVSASPTRSSSRYNTLHHTRSSQSIIVEQRPPSQGRSLHSKENNNTIESVTASARKVLGLIRQRRSNQSLRTY